MALYEAIESAEFYDGTSIEAGMYYRTEELDHADLIRRYPDNFRPVLEDRGESE